jgi:hypothetical protein
LGDLGLPVKNTPAYMSGASVTKKKVLKLLATCNNLLLFPYISDIGFCCSILVDLVFLVQNTPAYSLDASAMKKRVSKQLATCNNLLLNFIDDFEAF